MKIDKITSGERWEAIATRHEIEQLRREHAHLLKKGEERDLSLWEQQRLTDCLVELMKIAQEVSARKFPGTKRKVTTLTLYR
jgi:hypothetical protein